MHAPCSGRAATVPLAAKLDIPHRLATSVRGPVASQEGVAPGVAEAIGIGLKFQKSCETVGPCQGVGHRSAEKSGKLKA